MTKKDIFEAYEKVKDNADCVILKIHMPTGETETIVNSNVAEKMKYINKTYSDELVHSNCKDIYIEDVIFCTPDDGSTFNFGEAIIILKEGGKVARKTWDGEYERFCQIEKDESDDGIILSWIKIRESTGSYIWHPSQEDMLADDWYEVD